MRQRLLIFIVTYNAERTVTSVLKRIPAEVFNDSRYDTEILIIDDQSKDSTFSKGLNYKRRFDSCPLTILKNPVNLGYGGNQQVGYRYALDNGFSIVALLHGDGQYAPEQLPNLIEPFLNNPGEVSAVFGSRMMKGNSALRGGMPPYKFVGNKILTFLQNHLVGSKLSEWHSGYRLYSCDFLRKVPFERNSQGFDFDTDIIVQLKASDSKIVELPIPTYYGDEISHVNGTLYGAKILITCFQYRCQQLGIFYDPKFDLEIENHQYQEKFSFESSHSLPLKNISKDDNCLLVGCGPLELVKPFLDSAKSTAVIDLFVSSELAGTVNKFWQADLDHFNLGEETKGSSFDKVLALDVIEHLKSPEAFCESIRKAESCKRAEVIFTTPNIAFLPLRIMLLLGLFNYGKRGILDRTHTRLFTYSSLRRLLSQAGFQIIEMRGIPAPIPLALGNNLFARTLLSINSFLCNILPGLFSFQLMVRAKARPTVESLLQEAKEHSEVEAVRLS